MTNLFKSIWRIPRNALILLVRFYQKTLSPDHSFWGKALFPHGYCKFKVTCSEYMIRSLRESGLVVGFLRGCWRILRCNPWSEGGEDRD